MKKIKEFLLQFIPLIILTVLPIVLFITNQTEDAFVGNAQYLRLFLNDGVFWNAIFYTYFKAIIFSIIIVLILVLLCHFIKFMKKRKIFYPVSIAVASLVSFFCLFINKTNFFGLPMGVYDPSYLITNSPPVSVSVYEILLAFQIGFLTVFLFWLAEMLFEFFKNRKST